MIVAYLLLTIHLIKHQHDTTFSIHIEQREIDDLHRRLDAARWPDEVATKKRSYGANKAYVQEFCAYRRKQETYLDTFSHFKTTVDDLTIVFCLVNVRMAHAAVNYTNEETQLLKERRRCCTTLMRPFQACLACRFSS